MYVCIYLPGYFLSALDILQLREEVTNVESTYRKYSDNAMEKNHTPASRLLNLINPLAKFSTPISELASSSSRNGRYRNNDMKNTYDGMYIYVHKYIYMYMFMYIYIFIYISIHIYMYTNIYRS
jgi:hypothetical protein